MNIPEDLVSRMLDAADTLSEVASVLRPNDSSGWCRSQYSSSMLHVLADQFATERAKSEAEVEELADLLLDVYPKTKTGLEVARAVLAAGYRKGGDQ